MNSCDKGSAVYKCTYNENLYDIGWCEYRLTELGTHNHRAPGSRNLGFRRRGMEQHHRAGKYHRDEVVLGVSAPFKIEREKWNWWFAVVRKEARTGSGRPLQGRSRLMIRTWRRAISRPWPWRARISNVVVWVSLAALMREVSLENAQLWLVWLGWEWIGGYMDFASRAR
jgi:hypothetical protein